VRRSQCRSRAHWPQSPHSWRGARNLVGLFSLRDYDEIMMREMMMEKK
jgi:hypothetical protein